MFIVMMTRIIMTMSFLTKNVKNVAKVAIVKVQKRLS